MLGFTPPKVRSNFVEPTAAYRLAGVKLLLLCVRRPQLSVKVRYNIDKNVHTYILYVTQLGAFLCLRGMLKRTRQTSQEMFFNVRICLHKKPLPKKPWTECVNLRFYVCLQGVFATVVTIAPSVT